MKRERIVASNEPGALVVRITTTPDGGSSKNLRSAFAASCVANDTSPSSTTR
jgi:hypothetical protein